MKNITTFTTTFLMILPAGSFAQDASKDTFAGHDIKCSVSGGVASAPSFLDRGETSVSLG